MSGAFNFTLAVAPRTKKSHNSVVPGRTKDGRQFARVLPSAEYEQFRKQCVKLAASVNRLLKSQGAQLPIAYPIGIKAMFYRQANIGDHTGFTQALGDVLQDMGIITNDRIIAHWDGTRRMKDASFPRVEIWITPFVEEGALF